MFEPRPWCTFHPVSDGDRSIMDGLRMRTAPYKGKLRGTAAGAQFDQIMGHVPVPEQVTFREDHVGRQSYEYAQDVLWPLNGEAGASKSALLAMADPSQS